MSKEEQLQEIEALLTAYEKSGMAINEFSEEFFRAVRLMMRYRIPLREIRLSVTPQHGQTT